VDRHHPEHQHHAARCGSGGEHEENAMNMELAIGLVLGLLMGATIMGVFMGTVAHNNYEKYKEMKHLAFEFEEKWLDALEGNTDRQWLLRAEGAEDPYIVRGRPDLEERREKATSKLSEDAEEDVIDLTWAAE